MVRVEDSSGLQYGLWGHGHRHLQLSTSTGQRARELSIATEPNLAVTKIEANPSGDALTVEAAVKEGASRGRYVVQVMTDAGSSPAKATKSNTIEIVF